MKKLALVVITVLACTSVFAQMRNVTLVMNQQLDGKPFAFNMAVPHGNDPYMFKLTRLQYYISGIMIVHDGGQTTSVADLYLLVNPSKDSRFDLGAHAVSQIEGIRFNIGVDASRNHADPSQYPSGHPLAPKNPDMHWGWTAGYRFVALEGVAGPTETSLTKNFQLHSLGDELYTPVSVTTPGTTDGNNLIVTLNADYAHALDGIDVSDGPVVHGAAGETVIMMQNFKTQIFSPGPTAGLSLEPNASSSALHAYPNPATHAISIEADLPDLTSLHMIDVMGRTVAIGTLADGHALLPTTDLPVGSYTVVAVDRDQLYFVRVSIAP